MKATARAPTRLSSRASGSAAVVALGSSGYYSWTALLLGTVGLLLIAVGLVRGRTTAVSSGAFGLFIAAIVAGVLGAPVVPILGSVTCAVLAWDIGGYAISLGTQLGRSAETMRIEAVHIAGSVGVGTVTAGIGYGLYRAGPSEQPIAALGFFLVAAVLLVVALD